jgi:glycosyltransferase A (GT-A) superfamily protein (DUF2064 family)
LTPPLTSDEAAELAAAAIADTVRVAGAIPAPVHLLAWDGRPPASLPVGWSIVAQPQGDLDARLIAAFDAAGPGPAVLVGMDTPQLQARQLTAFDPDHYDACLGLAGDGGYWAIGFANCAHAESTIAGVPMSCDDTGTQQLRRLRAAGLRVQLLDELTDVDTYADARAVSKSAPATDFARTLRLIEDRRPVLASAASVAPNTALTAFTIAAGA